MEFLPLSAIAIDCDMLFARAGFDRATVERYSNAITDRHTLPPVTVYFDGADYWLADGFHRFAACEELGCTDIPVDIRHGTKQEALLFSLGADATHGKPRVSADEQNAYEKAVRFGLCEAWNAVALAKLIGCSNAVAGQLTQVARAEHAAAKKAARRLPR